MTTPEKADIVSRLNDIWSDDDHERGCEGRTYSCSCGFDERTRATAKDAATEIASLRRELEEMRALLPSYYDGDEEPSGSLADVLTMITPEDTPFLAAAIRKLSEPE